jgi:4-amino-4-deoxy-L-arabinose transferase-like glycosyltransferase
MLLRASLTASLTVASIWLLMRLRDTGGARLAIGTGIVLAAGYLMRPVGLAMLAGPLVLLLDTGARRSWRTWVLPLMVGIVIGFSPFVARNAIVGGPLLTFSNRGVEAMIQGNHSAADPGFLTLPSSSVYRELMEGGSGSVPRALVATIGTWPEDGRVGWWLWHEARKLLAILRNYEYANNVNFYFFRRTTPVLALLPTFGVVCSLGLVGAGLLVRRGRDRTGALLLALAAGGLVGIMLLALAAGRYRLPLAMIGTVPAGVTLSALWEWLAERRWRQALLCGSAVALVALVSYRVVPTRVLFDAAEQPHFIRGADATLYERMAALRVREFAEEARLLRERGDANEARALLVGYLDEMRRTIAATPPPQDLNLRRTILNQTYTQLLWSRDLFAGRGFDDFAGAVSDELEWIRANT